MNANEINECNVINKMNNHFKIPIFYNDKKMELKKNIINDLELINTIDVSCNPVYSYYFNICLHLYSLF